MIIKNGLVYNENGDFEKRDIYIDGELITDKAPVDSEVIDAEGLYVIPGLIDVHTHGAVGHDFCDADLDGLYKIAEFEKSKGVTAFCPTSMTLSEEMLTGIFATSPRKSMQECLVSIWKVLLSLLQKKVLRILNI